MDQYFPVVSSLRKTTQEKPNALTTRRYKPYTLNHLPKGSNERNTELDEHKGDHKPSSSAITKHLLRTLSDESNPITHSNIGERSDRVISTSSGHQVSDGQLDRRLYLEHRERKLALQREFKVKGREPPVLANVRVYIDGFLNNTTDIEMRRTVTLAGGQMVATMSGCTHVLTSQQLSGTKTQKLLTMKPRNKVHVIKPEWVIDSIQAGKRQPERAYAVVKDSSTNSIHNMLKK